LEDAEPPTGRAPSGAFTASDGKETIKTITLPDRIAQRLIARDANCD
jgi:hypothetical protein